MIRLARDPCTGVRLALSVQATGEFSQRTSVTLPVRPPLGIFIHDGLHTYEHEYGELEAAMSHLSPTGTLITDNADLTRALADICARLGLQYHEFRKQPVGHVFVGGAMG